MMVKSNVFSETQDDRERHCTNFSELLFFLMSEYAIFSDNYICVAHVVSEVS